MTTTTTKEKKKKKHNFDLKKLEDIAIDALIKFYTDDNVESRTTLFKSVKDLAHAILCVSKNFCKYNINFEETAYEYSIYLFERIVLGTFNPFKDERYVDRFPFQFYISRNIYHIVLTKRPDKVWHETIADLEFLLENDEELQKTLHVKNTLDERFDKKFLAKKLYRSLCIFYTQEEIERYFPLTLDLLYSGKPVWDNCPQDLKEFYMVVIGTSKRLNIDHNVSKGLFDVSNVTFKKAKLAAVRSTIFLSACVNSNFFQKELLLALDLDSLYRLVHIMGGRTLIVPTQKELDTLVGSVVAASKVILENKPVLGSILESREDYELQFSKKVNTQHFVSKIIECYNLFGESEDSEPLINTLVLSIQAMGKLIKELGDTQEDHPIQILNKYKELSETFKALTSGLLKISINDINLPSKNKSTVS